MKAIDRQMDELFERLDTAFTDGRFGSVNEEIRALDLEPIPSVLILSWLTATAWAKRHLPARPAFVNRCEAALKVKCPRQSIERLMEGLR